MQVAVGRDEAIFNLKERARTVPHVPMPEELAREARQEEQRERHYRNPNRWPAPPYGRVYPETHTVWAGDLSIQIDGYSDGVRRTGLTDAGNVSRIWCRWSRMGSQYFSPRARWRGKSGRRELGDRPSCSAVTTSRAAAQSARRPVQLSQMRSCILPVRWKLCGSGLLKDILRPPLR